MSRINFRDIANISTNWLRRFARSTSGNTALLFGLTTITVLTAGGAELDLSRTIYAKNRAAAALDAAALAVAVEDASYGLSTSEMTELAQQVFDANYASSGLGTTGSVVVTQNSGSISLSVNGTVPTTLLQLAGRDMLTYTFVNEVSSGSTSLEVALVLDCAKAGSE